MEKEKKQIWFEASISFNLRKYTRTHNDICVVREKKNNNKLDRSYNYYTKEK